MASETSTLLFGAEENVVALPEQPARALDHGAELSNSLPSAPPQLYLYDTGALCPHDCAVSSLPSVGKSDQCALGTHLRSVVKTAALYPYKIRLSPQSLIVNDNTDGTMYISVEFKGCDIQPLGVSPPFPCLDFGVPLHVSIGYKVGWPSWHARHRGVIRCRALLAGFVSSQPDSGSEQAPCGVYAQFLEWGRSSSNFLIKSTCEFGVLCSMLREELAAAGCVDTVPDVDFHVSWPKLL